jgi:hypothetical protein
VENRPSTSDDIMSPAPAAVIPRLMEFNSGNETSRAPICSGIAKLISPVRKGIAMKKIMTVPWVLKSCEKCSGEM